MRPELLPLPALVVLDGEPVVAAWHRLPVVGPVPSLARRADLLELLPEAVKDMDFCAGLPRKPDNVPGLVVAVAVRGEKVRVVQHRHPHAVLATAVDVPRGDHMTARAHALKGAARLPRAAVKAVLVIAVTGRHRYYNAVFRKSLCHHLGHHHRR